MPIEFRCPQCGKLLRTADDTAGKQARCPACGSVQTIPDRSTEPGEDTYSLSDPPPQASPFAGAALPQPGSYDPDNPYAAPTTSGEVPFDHYYDSYPRTGPPWERDRPSFISFWQTIRSAFSALTLFFIEMRREGGILLPLGFALVGCMIGTVAEVFYSIVFTGLFAGLGNMGPEFLMGGVPLAFGMLFTLVLAPVAVVIGSFIYAGILHLSLMLVGGATFPFETTYRVVAYSLGCTSLFDLIPFCGNHISGLALLIFSIFGVIHMHEISAGKGVLAVFLPVIVCCGGILAFVFFWAAIA